MPKAKAKEKVRALVAAQWGSASYFLKIDGIRGESQDRQHRDEIKLQSFAWGNSNAEPRAVLLHQRRPKSPFRIFRLSRRPARQGHNSWCNAPPASTFREPS